MPESTPAPADRTVSEKILRVVVLGALAILSFYLDLLRGILKLGMLALKSSNKKA